MGQAKPPRLAHLKCPILSWVSDLPDSGGSETNFEFDFYENLATEAIATVAHLSRAVAKFEIRAVEARSPAPLGGSPKANSEARLGAGAGRIARK